jgi:hypothetical protein
MKPDLALPLCLAALGLAACGRGAPEPTFSPAAISVDSSKKMGDLTSDERLSACNEFARALTASFGPRDVACKFRSLNRSAKPDCQSDYDQCLGDTPAMVTLTYCHDNMSDMWSCPITIGQYQACFNDLNRELFDTVLATPVCGVPATTPPYPPSCQAAPCDYLWLD